MKRVIFFLWFQVMVISLSAQAPANWFNLDLEKDGVAGVSTEQMYEKLTGGRKPQTVVVAVIDSGVDFEHEDLKDIMWVNPGEIAGNGIDDDNNGYIDDVHGWNFLGNANGENVKYDNLEVTRLFAKYRSTFEGKKREDIPKGDRALYDKWVGWKELIDRKSAAVQEDYRDYSLLKQAMDRLKEEIPEPITKEKIKGFKSDTDVLNQVAAMFVNIMEQYNMDFPALEKDVNSGYEYFSAQINYYDPSINSRKIVGDNYEDLNEIGYGNSDVRGPDAMHGTHVAGIIAAVRDNDIGMNGVAANVRIMSLRAVPEGDEHDKDVANAIRYAVDNGASIINMSFGKGESPQKQAVDDAVRYAAKNDVLLIHAAGNEGQENSAVNNYPNDRFLKKGLFKPRYAENWIEVGASSWEDDETLAADFSNYSNFYVDVFAPGVEIYSTTPFNEYENLQGTSMASPVVAGIAAVIRSYFPDLTAKQVKQVIMDSVVRKKQAVNVPGKEGAQMPFGQLSVTGGIVNVYQAFELAAQTKGKKKKSSRQAGMSGQGANGKKRQAVP